jgi:hypothetical protein
MARHAGIRALTLVLAAIAALSARSAAQSLQRLTVTQLTLSADTAFPRVEQPFHLIITAHVRERVTEIDNVDLPILAELELLGDEHAVTAGANGTTYRETIAVVAHHSGGILISPVTLDAIDARDGKGKRYFSNALTLHVSGAGLTVPSGSSVWDALGTFARAVATIVLVILGFIGIGILLAAFFRGRPAPAPAVTLPPPAPVRNDPRAMLVEALAAIRSDPTRAGAMRARASVRRMVGATEAETLSDVLQRPAATDREVRNLLRALERAAFTYDSDLSAAVAAATSELERATR